MEQHHHMAGTGSKAAISEHPLHPMLIPFPIAFLIGAFVTDLTYWWTAEAFWALASYWLILAGLVTGIIAAIPGIIDLLTIAHARSFGLAWLHAFGNGTILILALGNLLIRAGDPVSGAIPYGLGISALVTVLLSFTGWLGGEMAYRHGIGVSASVGQIISGNRDHENGVVGVDRSSAAGQAADRRRDTQGRP